MPLLAVKNLTVEYPSRRGGVVAVEKVNLSLEPGEILGIVGGSGAGKSTVANAIIGLIDPPGHIAAGEITLDGERIDDLDEAGKQRLRGGRIGSIFQDPMTSLNPVETIGFHLVETIRLHTGHGFEEARGQAVDLLRQVGIDSAKIRFGQYPHQFSGGMRQRVLIALALCADPQLVIADEPTTALDVSVQSQVLTVIKRLCRDRNAGVVFISHDMGVIADVTDRLAVMYQGRIVEAGKTRRILRAPRHEYTKTLIGSVPRADGRMRRFPVVLHEPEARARPVLRDHWLGQAGRQPVGRTRLLRLRNVHMRFVSRRSIFKSRQSHFDAVTNVSFDIGTGEVFGLVGESGSGKSTIARIVTGIYAPTRGSVAFDGQDMARLRVGRAGGPWRRQMQMIFQDPFSSLNGRMRVMDIVSEPIRFHGLVSSNGECARLVRDLLSIVGLDRHAKGKFPHEFSTGERQRISIARALATRPKFLVCDEPTSALDVLIQAQILNLLKDLQEDLRLTMLFISHDLPVIRQMCDRVGVMKAGRLLEIAETETLFSTPSHDYTKSLLEMMPRFETAVV